METIRIELPHPTGPSLPLRIELIPSGRGGGAPEVTETRAPEPEGRTVMNELRAPKGFLPQERG